MTSYAADLASHVSDDLLSAYLDGELPRAKIPEVEDHLSSCPNCRARLDGLRRVVRSLARLERAAPPSVLAQRVERRIALQQRDASFVDRLEGRLRGLPLDSPMVATFAVVLALGVILYLFAHQVAHHRGDVSLRVAAPEAAEGLLRDFETVEIDGRHLTRRGDLWLEDGLADAASEAPVRAVSQIAYDSTEGEALRAEFPWIEELLTLTGASAVEFELDEDEVVRLHRNLPPTQP